jgi:PAS domain S-box-containing protein
MLETLGQSLPLPLLSVGRHGRILWANDQVGRVLRRQKSAFEQMPLQVFLDPQSLQPFLSHLWEAFKNPGTPKTVEVSLLRPDESRQGAVLHSLALEPSEHDGARCQIAIVPKDPAPGLAAAREILGKLPYGSAWLDRDEKVVECSRALATMLGFEKEQLSGCPIGRLFFDWQSGEALAAALRGQPCRMQGVRRDGSVVPVEVHLMPVDEGSGDAFLLLARDVRDQEALERRSLRIAELERQAVGRELHDALGQNLVGMAFLADELVSALSRETVDALDARQRAKRLAGLAREIIAISRDLVRGLYPVGLTQGGLSTALRDLAHRCQSTWSVHCQARCQAVELPPETAEHLFRIAQEAITNALKHANCENIQIVLAQADEAITLSVSDDGRGIRETDLHRFGNGIQSMRHRCQLIGAILRVVGSKEDGTLVAVRLPR